MQSDICDRTLSLVVCPLTSRGRDAGLLRVAVAPSDRLSIRQPSWVMVEKLTSIRRDRATSVVGRLSDEEITALNRSLAVFLGFA